MRKFLIAGNWKMNAGPSEADELSRELASKWKNKTMKAEALLCPPFISIPAVVENFSNTLFQTGAQDVSTEDNGAFTGQISTTMLKDAGCTYVIVGHSERREYNNEDDALVSEKTKKAISDGLNAIVCVGEKLDERKSGNHEAVVKRQVETVLDHLSSSEIEGMVIAYEPVWAIGTGETATPDQAQSMHKYIRSLIEEKAGKKHADSTRILYGGSMKPANAEELLSQPDVDGGLIGGASLDANSFSEIISIADSI